MNIVHLKYAVEIEKTRSISKAAENLFMAQPNLSRAVKELEESIGITIFKRTPKGISVTPDGEEFLQHARRIIRQVNEVEQMYSSPRLKKRRFSVCVPRASYISIAFTEFAKEISSGAPAELSYNETGAFNAIDNVIKEKSSVAIVRYQLSFEKYFRMMFDEKRLSYETIADFSYRIVMSRSHRLASCDDIRLSQLADCVEICHADQYVPSLPSVDVKKSELSENVDKRIYIFERGSQFELLESVKDSFMWVSPIPPFLLKRHSLVEKRSSDSNKIYRDVLIFKKGHVLSELEKSFITEVCNSKRKYLD